MRHRADGAGARYWDRHARRYDRSMNLLGRPLPRMRALASAAVRGKRTLEVAAGTGILSIDLAREASELVATDYSSEMIRALDAKLADARGPRAHTQQADVYALPFEPHSFDVVVGANFLHLVPDLDAALDALRRVVRPGGLLVLPTFLHDETMLSRVISRVLALTGFPGSRRFTSRTLRAALERNGLAVECEEMLGGPIPIGYVQARTATRTP